ncbi:MAG: hypothetical protein CFH39_01240, partial [Alphaproteobacteria bacterium MarineAlpha10_Bin2]
MSRAIIYGMERLTRSCTHKGDSQIASDVIQAPELWE